MKEELLHFAWKYRKLFAPELKTHEGETVKVIRPGEYNVNAGPDFLNARIRIGEREWAGNVEIHIRSSDWNRHRHQEDHAYNNVILHVVYENDATVMNALGTSIPTLSIAHCLEPELLQHYDKLMASKDWIPCQSRLPHLDTFHVKSWLMRMLSERLKTKTDRIGEFLKNCNNDWQEAFYRLLFRNFGFKINAEPFENLALSLPLRILAREKDSLLKLEALLFGQAGMLEQELVEDTYFQTLKAEYTHLRLKYKLKPLNQGVWRYLRMHPANFPSIRLAQAAMLIHKSSGLFSLLLNEMTPEQIRACFALSASSNWDRYFRFGVASSPMEKRLGDDAIHSLIINTVAPMLFAYGTAKDEQHYKERAINLLEILAPEKNNIISKYAEHGIRAASAAETQALLTMKEQYCDLKKCLFCGIGVKVLEEQ